MTEQLDAEVVLDYADAQSRVEDLRTGLETALVTASTTFETAMADALTSIQTQAADVFGSFGGAGSGAGLAEMATEANVATEQLVLFGTEGAAAVDQVTVAGDEAAAALADTAQSATDAGSGIADVGAQAGEASSNVDLLGGATGALHATSGLAEGSSAGLGAAVGGMGKEAGAAVGVVGAAAAGVGALAEEGLKAVSAGERFNTILGEQAKAVQDVKVGDYRGDIFSLGIAFGSTNAEMQNSVATIYEHANAAGFGAQKATTYTDEIVAMGARAVALNPQLGNIGDVVDTLETKFARSRGLVQYGISISQAQINTRAMTLAGVDNAANLTVQDKAYAGLQIATEKYGNNLSEVIAKGADNAANKQKALDAELKNTIEDMAKPLAMPLLELLQQALPVFVSAGQLLTILGKDAIPAVSVALEVAGPAMRFVATEAQHLEPVLKPLITAFVALEIAAGVERLLAAVGATMGVTIIPAGGLAGALGGVSGALGVGTGAAGEFNSQAAVTTEQLAALGIVAGADDERIASLGLTSAISGRELGTLGGGAAEAEVGLAGAGAAGESAAVGIGASETASVGLLGPLGLIAGGFLVASFAGKGLADLFGQAPSDNFPQAIDKTNKLLRDSATASSADVAKLFELNTTLRQVEDGQSKAEASLASFKSVLDKSPESAQALITKLNEAGVSTARYQKILDDATASQLKKADAATHDAASTSTATFATNVATAAQSNKSSVDKDAAKIAAELEQATGRSTAAVQGQATAYANAAAAGTNLKAVQDLMNTGTLTLAESENQEQAGLFAVQKALDAKAASGESDAEVEQVRQAAVISSIKQEQAYEVALRNSGRSVADVTTQHNSYIDALKTELTTAGYLPDEIQAMLTKFGLIPSAVSAATTSLANLPTATQTQLDATLGLFKTTMPQIAAELQTQMTTGSTDYAGAIARLPVSTQEALSAAAGIIGVTMPQLAAQLLSGGTGGATSFGDSLIPGVAGATDAATAGADKIIKTGWDLAAQMASIGYDAGSNLDTSMSYGISANANLPTAAAKQLVRDVETAVKNAGSPSEHLFYDAAASQIAAYAEGFASGGPAVVDAATAITRAAAAGTLTAGPSVAGGGSTPRGVLSIEVTVKGGAGATPEVLDAVRSGVSEGVASGLDGETLRDVVMGVRTG